MDIEIAAEISVVHAKSDRLAEPKEVAQLADLVWPESFATPMAEYGDPMLAKAGIGGGMLRFHVKGERVKAVIMYTIAKDASGELLDALAEYTLDQFSEGIGENLAKDFEEKTGLLLDFASVDELDIRAS